MNAARSYKYCCNHSYAAAYASCMIVQRVERCADQPVSLREPPFSAPLLPRPSRPLHGDSMLRLLRRSNSNRSNCSADAVVVIPNAATNHDRAGTCTSSTLTTTAINNNGTGTGGDGYRVNRYSMVESCAPPASTRAKDLEQHRRYRPHSQARRLRKTRQVRDDTLC